MDKDFKLKKCPFCGCSVKVYKGQDCFGYISYVIKCSYCNSFGQSSSPAQKGTLFLDKEKVITDKEAIEKIVNNWNNRIT